MTTTNSRIVPQSQMQNMQSLHKRGGEIWRPREPIAVADWCVENLRLAPEWEASAGRFNVKNNPFLVDILNAFLDPTVYEISLKKSTQVGGTYSLISAVIALSELDPAPAMVVLPDRESAIEFRDRLYANCKASKATRDKVPIKKNWNTRAIDLMTSRIYLAWSGSAQRLRGRACKRVFRSECDVYGAPVKGGDPIKASSQRVKRFFWSQIYNESTPDSDHSTISSLYDKSNRQHWWCKCPNCGRYQVLRFFPHKGEPHSGKGGVKGITDLKGNLLPKAEAMENAYVECVHGGCRIDTFGKNKMVCDGLWLASGQYIDEEGMVCGSPDTGRRHLGFHLWSMHSPTITIGRVVEAYIEARIDNKLREFFQDWLGLKFVGAKRISSWAALGRRLTRKYNAKRVHPRAWFLTAGCDVQEDGIYYVVRSWGHGGSSWLVDHGMLERYDLAGQLSDDEEEEHLVDSIKSDLAQIDVAVMNRRYVVDGGVQSKSGHKRMQVICAGIDANFRTRDVHEFIQTRLDDRLRAVRGDNKLSPDKRFRMNVVDAPRRGGAAYVGGLKLYGIYTAAYKEDLLQRWSLEPGADGFWALPSLIVRDGERYLKQVTNEVPEDYVDQQGFKKRRWVLRNTNIGNHYLDCEVYAMAIAEMHLEDHGLTWDSALWVPPVPVDEEVRNVITRDTQQEDAIVARDYF